MLRGSGFFHNYGLNKALEIFFSCHVLVFRVQVIAVQPMWALHLEVQIATVEYLVQVGHCHLMRRIHLCIQRQQSCHFMISSPSDGQMVKV